MLNPADVLGAISSSNGAAAGEQLQLDTIRHDSNGCHDNLTAQSRSARNIAEEIEERPDSLNELVETLPHYIPAHSPLQHYFDTQYMICQCPHIFGYQLPRGLRFLQTVSCLFFN